MSMWGSQLETWTAFVQVQSIIGSFPDIPWDAMPLYREIRAFLTPLMQNFDYVLPDVQCICFWGYIKSSALILTPIVAWRIFKFAVDWERWEHEIVHNLRPAILCKLSYWVAANFLSVALALAIDCIDCSSLQTTEETMSASFAGERRNSEHHDLEAGIVMNETDTASAEGTCIEFQETGSCRAWWHLVTMQGLSRPTIGWIVALVSLNTLALLLWLTVTLLARFKNRKGHNTGFWFMLSGTIKKVGMILISMSYLPICNILFDNVRPFEVSPMRASASNSSSLKWGFPTGGCIVTEGNAGTACLDYPRGVRWMGDPQYLMFIVSSIFAVLYMTCIPIYLAHHVREAVSVLDRNNPRHVRLFQEVQTLDRQRTWRARLLAAMPTCLLPVLASEEHWVIEVKRKRLLRRAHSLYAEAVCDFDDARSALYCSYKWNNKYFKMVGIFERVLILLVVFLLSDPSLKLWLGQDMFESMGLQQLHMHKLLTAVITAVFLTISLVGQPFSDWQDGLIDGVCRFANFCNAAVVFLATKPSIFFLYQPFDATAVPGCAGNRSETSNIEKLGLAIAGVQSDSSVNATATTAPSANIFLESTKPQDEVFCKFLHLGGYLLGVLNILCFILIMLSMLASPVRWWLSNRRAKNARSSEYELQEKNAMNRRRSSILGLSSNPDTKLLQRRKSIADGQLQRFHEGRRQNSTDFLEETTTGVRTEEKTQVQSLKRTVSFEATNGNASANTLVSRSSRRSLGLLTSNDVAARGRPDADSRGKKQEAKKLSRSKSALMAYQGVSDFLLG
jgi:hypothetical protein